MKFKIQRVISVLSLIVILLALNCKKAEIKSGRDSGNPSQSQSKIASDSAALAKAQAKDTRNHEAPIGAGAFSKAGASTLATGTFTCGSSISDNWATNGFHKYTGYILGLSSAEQGSTITLNLSSYDVPNRFTVYDASHNFVAGTNWMGFVNSPGPWGQSLNTPQNQAISFIRRNLTNYSLEVETVVNGMSDSWTATVSCKYIPKPVSIPYTNAAQTTALLNIFRGLSNVDFVKLSTAIGLSHTLVENDIDFVHLYKSYDANAPDTAWGISASFKSNTSTTTTNYAFAVYSDGVNIWKPYIAKSVTNSKLQNFDLDEGAILTVTNYNSANYTLAKTTGNYMRTTTFGCGQAVMNCVIDAYTNHGWVSVWANIQSVLLPHTLVAITAVCVVKNCPRP